MVVQGVIKLEGPSDTVSSLHFSPDNPVYLLASSWDGHLRLFDTNTRAVIRDFEERAPVLDAVFLTETRVVSASIDGALRYYDLENGRLQQEVKIHQNAISSLVYASQHNLLMAGSWDQTISIHDLSASQRPVLHLELPEKVFAMSANEEYLVVAMANRHVYVYSFEQIFDALMVGNKMVKPMQRRESSLKFMTRTLQCTLTSNSSLSGYVSTSIEGRVAVEFFDPSEASQARKYAFKCHRQKSKTSEGEDEDIVYPVNAVVFHPVHETFATAGGDGVVSLWDLKAKKRVKQYASIGEEIQTLAFSPDGKYLAMGTGALGSAEHIATGSIFFRELAPQEGRGKS